jgi:hypothetical protein
MLRIFIAATTMAVLLWSLPVSAEEIPRCSSSSIPAADKARLTAEYKRRFLAEGKTKADAWAGEQGRRHREIMERQGICPPREPANIQANSAPPPREQPTSKNRKKGKCTRTVWQTRHIASAGGGPMNTIRVPVCVN